MMTDLNLITFQMFPELIVSPVDAFFGSLAINMVLFAVLVILFLFGYSPVTFVRAKFGKKLLLFVAGRDRLLDIVVGKAMGGVVRTKRYGDYAIIPKTTYVTPNGFRAGIVFEPLGATIDGDFVKNSSYLKSVGVQSFGQFDDALQQVDKEKGKIKGEINQLAKFSKLTQEDKIKYKNTLIGLDRVTVAVDDIKNFFKWNLNPHVMAEAISRATMEGIQDWKKFDIMKWAFALLFLFMGFALAYVIIMSVTGSPTGGAGFVGGGLV